jgi:outer membrane lipoprotein-sorting protein
MSGPNHRPAPDVLDQATEALRNAPVPPGPPDDLVAATVQAVESRDRADVPFGPASGGRRSRLIRALRYAAAAAAVVALFTLAVLPWPGGERAVAFGRVLANVQTARSVTFVETQKFPGQRPLHLKYFLEGNHVRIELENGTAGILIVDTRTKKGVLLYPAIKAAKVLDRDPQFHANEIADWKPLDDLLRLKDQRPEPAGRTTIDGQETQVVRVRDGKWGDSLGDWTIWIDPRTERPVKIQFESKNFAPPVTKTLEHFSWNEKLDAKLFEVSVPHGYRLGLPWEKDVRQKPPGRFDHEPNGEKP